jgi:hypothetical protein
VSCCAPDCVEGWRGVGKEAVSPRSKSRPPRTPLSHQPKVPLSCIKPCIFPLVSVGIDDGSVEMAGRLAHVDGGEFLHPLSKSRPQHSPFSPATGAAHVHRPVRFSPSF